MEERGITIRGKVKTRDVVDGAMMRQGAAHGDKVNLGRPFGGNQSMGELA